MQTPTMAQYFTSPKSSRGSRLGRGSDSTSTMEQYGYSAPGTNITVSPTFSNIGNPTFSNIGNPTVEGMTVGNISLGGRGGSGAGPRPTPTPTPPRPTTPTTPTPPRQTTPTAPRPTTPRPSSGGGGGGGRNGGGGGGETRDNTLARALQGGVESRQSRNPRVSSSEIKSIMQETGRGPRGLRNAINEGNVNIGGKALDFLNKQLEKKGAKPVGPVSKPTPGKLQDKPQIAPFNSGSNPYAPFLAMQTGANKAKDNKEDDKKDNKKAEAKGKAQAAKKKK